MKCDSLCVGLLHELRAHWSSTDADGNAMVHSNDIGGKKCWSVARKNIMILFLSASPLIVQNDFSSTKIPPKQSYCVAIEMSGKKFFMVFIYIVCKPTPEVRLWRTRNS